MSTISFLGDVVPGGLLSLDLTRKALDNSVHSFLSGSDLVIANLESPFGVPEWQVSGKPVIYSRPEDAMRLKELNVSAVSLANNHLFDLGDEGFANTIRILEEMGIAWCGAGKNAMEARKPLYIDLKGVRLGFLAYCRMMEGVKYATADSSGVALMEEATVLEDIAMAKGKCDFLYVLLHWNTEYTWLPYPESPGLIRKLMDAGAAGVIGGHSHRLQSWGSRRGKPFFYSLGNFLFPDYIIGPPRTMHYPKEPIDLSSLPVMATNKPADKLYFRLWRKYSRIGIIGQIGIKGKAQSCAARYSWMPPGSSQVRFLPPRQSTLMDLGLKALGCFIGGPWYPAVYFAMMKLAQLLKKVVRFG